MNTSETLLLRLATDFHFLRLLEHVQIMRWG